MKLKDHSWIPVIVLSVIYILLGNSRSIEPNPFIPGALIAVNMIIPVIGGILFGPKCGALVGFIGTSANMLSPAGSVFELLSIIPHTLMGLFAGLIKKRYASPIAATSLIAGHLMNLLVYSMFNLIPLETIATPSFWFGMSYEIFIGIITLILLTSIYRFASQK